MVLLLIQISDDRGTHYHSVPSFLLPALRILSVCMQRTRGVFTVVTDAESGSQCPTRGPHTCLHCSIPLRGPLVTIFT